MNVWELPTSLEIGGVGFAIRSDFRAVLDVLKAFNDPDLEDDEKAIVCLKILYEDFDKIPQEKYEEAFQKAVEFIDAGSTSDDSPKGKLFHASLFLALLWCVERRKILRRARESFDRAAYRGRGSV